jgi:hypothetical protein
MTKQLTRYQKIAKGIEGRNPDRTFQWHANSFFCKFTVGWRELVVKSSITWYAVSQDKSEALDAELAESLNE